MSRKIGDGTPFHMHKILSKFIPLVKRYQSEAVLATAVILVSILSFQAGKFYSLDRTASQMVMQSANMAEILVPEEGMITPSYPPQTLPKPNPLNWSVVASKNSDKYHFLWCAGAAKISAKNKITFTSEAEAISAGYTLAGNCQK